jgi:serine/threonine protein kinase
MEKTKMVDLNVADFIMNEKNILTKVDNDFIIKGMYTFQSPKYLYMVMEYMKGGDVANLLERFGCFN